MSLGPSDPEHRWATLPRVESPDSNGSEGVAESPPTPPSERRIRVSWALSVLGLCVLLAGVFYMTSSAIGPLQRDFRDRRAYNEVKADAHRAFPFALTMGLVGLATMVLGSHLRRGAGEED